MTTKYEPYSAQGGSSRAVFVLLALLSALLVALLTLTSIIAPQARAQTAEGQRAAGPENPDNGFPFWYQDDTGMRLDLCLDTQGCGELEGIDGTQPISFPDNFPGEAVYWAAETGMPVGNGGGSRLVMAAEAFFADEGPASEGQQAVAGAILFRANGLEPNTQYTVTHPYGQEQVTTDGTGELRFENGAGCEAPEEGEPGFGEPFECDFSLALENPVFQQFLTWDSFGTDRADAPPAGQIGNPNVEHPVTGSPTGNNFFRIEGPDAGGPGVDVAETANFIVIGKLSELTAVATPRGGEFDEAQSVTLTASEDAANVFYTLDGTVPTPDSTPYTGPIDIPETATLKYIVVNEAGERSGVFEQRYVITLPTDINLDSGSAVIEFPQSTNISGQLASNGEPLANQQVQLLRRPLDENGFSPVADGLLTTDEQGNFSTRVKPEKNTIYRAVFRGENEALQPSLSPPERVNVRTNVTLRVAKPDQPVQLGTARGIFGVVRPAHTGAVRLVISRNGQRLSTERVSLDDNSRYRFVYRPTRPGNYAVRAIMPRHFDHFPGLSSVERFRVDR